MDFFKEISDMKFGEAYSEMSSILYGEIKEGMQHKLGALRDEFPRPSSYAEDVRDEMLDV